MSETLWSWAVIISSKEKVYSDKISNGGSSIRIKNRSAVTDDDGRVFFVCVLMNKKSTKE